MKYIILLLLLYSCTTNDCKQCIQTVYNDSTSKVSAIIVCDDYKVQDTIYIDGVMYIVKLDCK